MSRAAVVSRIVGLIGARDCSYGAGDISRDPIVDVPQGQEFTQPVVEARSEVDPLESRKCPGEPVDLARLEEQRGDVFSIPRGLEGVDQLAFDHSDLTASGERTSTNQLQRARA